MDKMNNTKTLKGKRNLLNSYESLRDKSAQLEDLTKFAREILNKLKTPYPQPQEMKDGVYDEDRPQDITIPDIIDIFDNVGDDMQISIESLRENLEEIINYID